MGDKSPMHPFLQSSVLILIVSCGNGRVSIGYRLDNDWRKVGATEICHRIETKYRPKFDPIKTARWGQGIQRILSKVQ